MHAASGSKTGQRSEVVVPDDGSAAGAATEAGAANEALKTSAGLLVASPTPTRGRGRSEAHTRARSARHLGQELTEGLARNLAGGFSLVNAKEETVRLLP